MRALLAALLAWGAVAPVAQAQQLLETGRAPSAAELAQVGPSAPVPYWGSDVPAANRGLAGCLRPRIVEDDSASTTLSKAWKPELLNTCPFAINVAALIGNRASDGKCPDDGDDRMTRLEPGEHTWLKGAGDKWAKPAGPPCILAILWLDIAKDVRNPAISAGDARKLLVQGAKASTYYFKAVDLGDKPEGMVSKMDFGRDGCTSTMAVNAMRKDALAFDTRPASFDWRKVSVIRMDGLKNVLLEMAGGGRVELTYQFASGPRLAWAAIAIRDACRGASR